MEIQIGECIVRTIKQQFGLVTLTRLSCVCEGKGSVSERGERGEGRGDGVG